MVKTGIKKYDELPARVAWIDVDYLRFRYVTLRGFLGDIEKELNKAIKKLQKKKKNGN